MLFLKKIKTSLVFLCLLLLTNSISMYAKEEKQSAPKLYAKSAVLMDAENGRILFEQNGDAFMPNASTTKILTAIVVLENCDLKEEVTISNYAASRPKVRLGMKEGEIYTVEELLYAMLLKSCNDCAVALAEYVAGSTDEFADMLNEKAKSIGCKNTYFVTPNGLDATRDGKEHGTTAKDLACMTRYALQNETFCQMIQTESYTFCDKALKHQQMVANADRFLTMSKHAIGVKTGFTSKAGYCFVGASKYEDRMLISVVLASGWPPNKNYKWSDTKALMEYGETQFDVKSIAQKQTVPAICVEGGVKETVSLKQSHKEMNLLLGQMDEVTTKIDLPESLQAPVYAGQIVGKCSFYVNGQLFDQTDIYAADSCEAYTFWYCLKRVVSAYLITRE